jgi:putative ABC transport system substrate-binding protein
MGAATIRLLAIAVAMLLGGQVRADDRPRVVALRTTDAAPYQIAIDALRARLGETVDFHVEQVEPGDEAEHERIAALEPAAIVSIGTRATLWARDTTLEIPIVFAMVLNPVSGGLIESMQRPGGRITGAALDVPPQRQLETLHEIVGAQRIGVLYNPSETGLLVGEAREAARQAGLELVPIEVHDPTELGESLARLDGSVEALWSVADRTVLSRGMVEQVLLYTLDHQIPFMGLSAQYVRAGALLALRTSYEENGAQAAELVMQVLSGAPAGSLPVTVPTEIEVVFNPRTAERLEVDLTRPVSLRLRSVR